MSYRIVLLIGLNLAKPQISTKYGATTFCPRREHQPAAHPLHDIFGLIVTQMMLAPEADGVLNDLIEGMRE